MTSEGITRQIRAHSNLTRSILKIETRIKMHWKALEECFHRIFNRFSISLIVFEIMTSEGITRQIRAHSNLHNSVNFEDSDSY